MNRRILAALAVAAVALAAVWYFGFRKAAPKAPATVSAPTTDGSGGGRGVRARRDGPEARGNDREQAILVDDDPAGALQLEGLVLDAADKPVAGATVVVSSNPRRTATTDDNGGFAFDKLVGRSYTLIARAAGGVAGPITAKLTDKSDPIVLHLRPGGAVKVTIVDKAAAAIPGATAELRGLDQQTATADAAGVAEFVTVVSGYYEVVAYAPGYAPSHAFTQVGTGPVEVSLVLVAGAPVSGIVVDDKRQPVGDARVIYSGASDWSMQADPRLDGAVTGPDGKFTFTALPAGSFRFVARHESFAPGSSVITTLDGSHATVGIEIALVAGATVAGSVVDGSQQPVASARVRIAVVSRGMVGTEPRQVFTDADGTFVVRGLPKKPLEAVALAETGSSANLAVDASAGDVKDVVITIDQTGSISGLVVDKTGNPLDGVQVSALPDFRAAGPGMDPMNFRLRGMPQELTNGAGEFEIVGLAPGSYNVRASRSSANRGRMFGLDGGQQAQAGARNLRIVLPADGGITGKVAFADGTVPSTFSVGVGFSSEPMANQDGAFELRDLPPQKYTVTVRGPEFDQTTVDVTVVEGEIADAGSLVVKKGRAIAGRVVSKGQPVADATVYAGRQIFGNGTTNQAGFGGPPGQNGNRTATTDADGKFRISGLGPGTVAVVAEHPDLGRSAARRVIRGQPDELALEITLAGWGVLTGTVKDSTGPAASTIVNAQSVSTPSAMYAVSSGDDGSFRFDKLAPDVYKVSAMLGNPMRGMSFYSKQVTVGPDAPARVDLEVTKGSVTVTFDIKVDGGTLTGGVAWLLSGAMAPRTVDELNLISASFPESQSTFSIVMSFRPPKYSDLVPGLFTACVALLPAGVDAMSKGMAYFERHGDEMPVTCTPVRVLEAPANQTATINTTLPPLLSD